MVASAIDPGALSPAVAAMLGALQGITEFLPVSSSGHLALAQAWLGIDAATAGHRFNVAVHAATLLAVTWVYRRDLGRLLGALVRPGEASEDRQLLAAVVIGSAPLLVVLLPGMEQLVISIEGDVAAVGVALLVTGAMLAVAHIRSPSAEGNEGATTVALRVALVIGLAQLLAVVPGISRSGSTIAAALVLGLAPATAARFSFLLMIPAVSAAAMFELVDLAHEPVTPPTQALPFAIGFATSLIVGLLSLQLLVQVVVRRRLGVFVPYLAVLGVAAIVTAAG